MSEQVNHPQHYGGEGNPYEAIKVVEAWNLGFCLGNVVKYISRAGKKDAGKVLEDLRKSRWYLDREIQKLEGEEKKFQPEKPPTFSGKEIVEWMSRWPAVHPVPDLYAPGGIVYYSDLNKHTAPILTAHDPEETLASGATNRLKPVEDKAEIQINLVSTDGPIEPVRHEAMIKWLANEDKIKEHVEDQAFDYGTGSKIKTLEDAYDEPLIRHTTEDSILAGLEKLKETAEDKKRKDEAFQYNFRTRHGAY